MAAPTATVRGTPSGIMLTNGHPTKIAFKRNPTICFWEEAVKPPGIDGGDGIDISTMHNVRYRTMAPRALQTLTPISGKAAFDPVIYTDILTLINMNDCLTAIFPDGTGVDFWGFLRKFEPGEQKEGEQPKADFEIVITNYDAANHVEAGPAVRSVAGT